MYSVYLLYIDIQPILAQTIHFLVGQTKKPKKGQCSNPQAPPVTQFYAHLGRVHQR